MQSEEYIKAALRALAEEDNEREAPLAVEDRVRRAFRRRYVQRKWRTAGAWGLAAAAAVVAIVVGLREHPKSVVPAPSVKAPRQLVAMEASAPLDIAPPPARKVVPKVRQLVVPRREIVTEFFPLLDVSMPFERGELLRMTVPASTMRRVGLPVNEDRLTDRITADVLVGEEGIARAIRFVSYEQ